MSLSPVLPTTARRRPALTCLLAAGVLGAGLLVVAPAGAAAAPAPVSQTDRPVVPDHGHHGDRAVRFATYNASLNRGAAGQLSRDLSTPDDPQAAAVAEVIQRERPDVLLVNEFDYVADGSAVRDFSRNYLQRSHHGAAPIDYPYSFTAPVNTGVPSGQDLDNDGTVGGGNDAFGFGLFPGQYGMVVYSRFPIDTRAVRTFQKFLWKDVPGALLPDDPATPAPHDWYSPEELAVLRLSSKSHWDVPVRIGRSTVHVLVSHPTPPSFDGPEDRNGTRNHDEIRFWADYVAGGRAGRYIRDDRGQRGGLRPGSSFVVMGDQNSDPLDGDSVPGAIEQLLDSPRLTDPRPRSDGGVEAAAQGGANATQLSDPQYDTADFSDVPGPGNLRTDYVLPSRSLRVLGSGIFWPTSRDPLFRLTGVFPFPTSDHRSVWVDVRVPRGR